MISLYQEISARCAVDKLLNELRMMGIDIEENVSGERITSFKVGGAVRALARPRDAEQLARLLVCARAQDVRTLVVGRGSNIVISDEGFDGVFVSLSQMRDISASDTEIIAGAGCSMSALASFAARHSLSGLEFAHGIPGSVGGGVYMNAGAYGGEISGILASCECYDIASDRLVSLTAEECGFSYRHSIFQERRELVILSARFAMVRGDETLILERMDDLRRSRLEKQPLEYPSAGSTFKRPKNDFAGRLIEEAGLKGYSVGGARVSEKHAGFVINSGGATCSDIKRLVEHIKKEVYEHSGVSLECEIEFV